ncbi:MAG: hypothetical protein K2M53_12335 [Muribaculaceae bacterium]|nr:hypothetical protein [Muribaculaceae bacterium]
MKKINYKATAATFVAAVAVLSCMSSCKGRTMDNIEPTGETIEVKIDPSDSAPLESDSIIIEESGHSQHV